MKNIIKIYSLLIISIINSNGMMKESNLKKNIEQYSTFLDENKNSKVLEQKLANDPYLEKHEGAITKFKLKNKEEFCINNNEELIFEVDKRDNKTIPDETKQRIKNYIELMKHTEKKNNGKIAHLKRKKFDSNTLKDITVLEKPKTKNSKLNQEYNDIFRDNDTIPGGTAGILTIEAQNLSQKTTNTIIVKTIEEDLTKNNFIQTRNGSKKLAKKNSDKFYDILELRHYKKATSKLKYFENILDINANYDQTTKADKEKFNTVSKLNKDDKSNIFQLNQDLKEAINKANESQKELQEAINNI